MLRCDFKVAKFDELAKTLVPLSVLPATFTTITASWVRLDEVDGSTFDPQSVVLP